MKKIKYIACLLSLAVVSGCDSILDKGPLDSFTNDNFWTGEGNISGYANAFYEQFLGYGNGNGYGDFYFKTLSELCQMDLSGQCTLNKCCLEKWLD